MKKIYARACLLVLVLGANAQSDSTSSQVLNKTQTADFFTPAFNKKNLISFPIFRAYSYTDKSGSYYVALSESSDRVKAKDTINNTIKAFNFKVDKGVAIKKWEINDFKLPETKGEELETSIWFWTKYCEFNDIDNDGLIEPIVVYGTFGINGYDDGRLKILTYYKGQKVAIRHQNSVTDYGRKTQIDLTFYSLPSKVQAHVKALMAKMEKNNHAIFPSSYLDKMSKKATQISN